MEEEGVLIQAFISGNEYAFSLLYKRYNNELFAYGTALGFDRETMKDAIQEVFYKLHRNKKQLGNIISLKYYLLRMLKNYLIDHYRSQMESSEFESHEFTFSITTTILDDLISEEEQLQLKSRVENLLKVLTDRQREAIYLRFIEELDYEEIGVLLNLSPHASRKLVSRGIKRMREIDQGLLVILFLYYI